MTYVDDNDICYEVSLLAENGELRHIILNEPEVDYEQEALIVDSDMLEQLYKEAEEIFSRVWADGHEFVSSTCEYNMTKDNKIPHGDIVFLFELKNGDAIKILYNVNRESFWNMTYLYFYDSYRNQQEESEKYREESGITRKVIKIYGRRNEDEKKNMDSVFSCRSDGDTAVCLYGLRSRFYRWAGDSR